MDVLVVDKNGTLIGGLEKRDFKVFDEGVEQTITNFSEASTPLTVVIMFEFSKTFAYYYDNVFVPIIGLRDSFRTMTGRLWSCLTCTRPFFRTSRKTRTNCFRLERPAFCRLLRGCPF
jgi:hypothetical protein